MRAKYYMKLFGQTYIRRSFAFLLCIIMILIITIILTVKNITPTIKVACQSKAKAVALKTTEEAVREVLESVEYKELVDFTYNNDGKIVGIKADAIQMNKLSSGIAYKVQERLSKLDDVEVKIPLAKIIGLSIFSGYGPKLNIKLVPYGNTTTKYQTDFVSEGINQTRHTIYIDISSTVNVVAPFSVGAVTSVTRITVAETVIVGDIPNTYYNIEGVEGALESGILDTM